jgi:regulator of sirC expression with transglutaminase-like and TPR domain
VSPSGRSDPFERIVGLPDDRIDLLEAALWVADGDDGPIDVPANLARVDALAGAAGAALGARHGERARIEALNRFLFVERGFAGNRDDYYDPANSYLHRVLDRRRGIPITLSILYMAVAGRLGMDVRGIGFPGHFLVKHLGDEETVVDPFFGCVLSDEACRERLVEMVGPTAEFRADVHLRSASNREILVRLLSNLKHIWIKRREFAKALSSCDRILLLVPDSPSELRERGLVYEALGCTVPALADYERVLAVAPDLSCADDVRERIASLRGREPTLH